MKQKTTHILLFGANGQVGWELRRTLSPLGRVVTAGIDGADEQLDMVDLEATEKLIARLEPDLIVNAAAYTAVDKAEAEPELAQKINADVLSVIGGAARSAGCPVVHYSTDYVFSGEGETPWKEQDETGPRSVYGRTKLAGEEALAASGAPYLVFRTAWVYGGRGNNFLLTMLRLFKQKKQLSIVADQVGAPTWSRHIAEATAQVLAQLKTGPGKFNFDKRSGIYHLTNDGQASWHEFAQAIGELAGSDCKLTPITSEEYPCAAERPGFSVLDNGALEQAFSIRLPHWRQGLELCFEELGD